MQPGGQLSITTEVENFPGFATAVQGPWLMEQMAAQASHVGTTLIEDMIVGVQLDRHPFVLEGDSGDTYLAETLIVCTGAQARWLGLPGETRLRGFGVSACATCDGFFFRGRTVAVVGGGNTAAEEALYLTNHASKVYLVHRRDTLRADKTNQARVLAHPKIEMVWNSVIEDVLGAGQPEAVSGIALRNLADGTTRRIDIDGLFVAIGHTPATELFRGKLDMDSDGYLVTRPDSTATNVAGVFAAGDVKDKIFRQAVTAAGMGCMAALEAERHLAHRDAVAAE